MKERKFQVGDVVEATSPKSDPQVYGIKNASWDNVWVPVGTVGKVVGEDSYGDPEVLFEAPYGKLSMAKRYLKHVQYN